MLVTKTVMTVWNPRTKKYYISKGYPFTKLGDEFKVEIKDLPKGSNTTVEIECDGCGKELKNIPWINYLKYVKEDGKYYCKKCALKLSGTENMKKTKLKKSKSFEQWCIDNNRQDVLDRWDYELNNVKPNEISYGSSNKKYYFKCSRGIHKSELKSIKDFTNGSNGSINCKQCNSIIITHPNLVKYFVNKNDTKKYSYGSHIKVPMKCPKCGCIKNNMSISTLINQGFGCSKCSDGVSYPEKFMYCVLEQLKKLKKLNDFEYQYYLENKRYDFYFELDNKKYAIETDGNLGHGKDNPLTGQTAEETTRDDEYKNRLAEKYDIELIRINCKKSELEYIKNNILQHPKLLKILNFKKENINWLECHKFACSSFVEKVCELWNVGIKNTKEIANKLKIDKSTVIIYLKQGSELKWCDYDTKYQLEQNRKNFNLMLEEKSKKIICLNDKEIFKSIKEATKKYKVYSSNIIACCKNKRKSAGKHPETEEKLRWMYYDEYIKQ